jgi:FixJ family two-component response regulator
MAFTVFIVDDDAAVVKALSRRLRIKGYETLPYTSPQAFLARHDPNVPGCALLDVAMPGLDGLELQKALTDGGSQRPVIFMTGKGDIPTSVRAMRAGAIDFLTKPVRDEALLEAISRAEKWDSESRQIQAELAPIESRMNSLTPREREVLSYVVAGQLNKQIAAVLGTVEQTVKVHRRRAMEKIGARSMVELMQIMQRLQPPFHQAGKPLTRRSIDNP